VIPAVHLIFENFPHKFIKPAINYVCGLAATGKYDFVTDEVITIITRWCNILTMTQRYKLSEMLYIDLNTLNVANNPHATKRIQNQLKKLFKIDGYDGTKMIDDFLMEQIKIKLDEINSCGIVWR
jgi:hypothetical protein